MNIKNEKLTLNLFMREKVRDLKLKANVTGMNMVKSHLNFKLISKAKFNFVKLISLKHC